MTVPAAVVRAYDLAMPAVEAVERYVSGTLSPWCQQRSYPFTGRRKVLESVAEKLESGRYRGWSRLDDLYACTVIVPTLSHIDGVVGHLQHVFDEVRTTGRGDTRKSPTDLRFDSTRFIARIREDAALEAPPGTHATMFEVQVVTAFEYAWQTATRSFAYKSNAVSWGRERLAAYLRGVVEQADLMILQHEDAAEMIQVSHDPLTSSKASIVESLASLCDEGYLPVTLIPQSLSRVADNLIAVASKVSDDGPQLAREVMDAFSEALHRNEFEPLNSGSVFQAILGWASSQERLPDDAGRFPLCPSEELELYGIDLTEAPWFEVDMTVPGTVGDDSDG